MTAVRRLTVVALCLAALLTAPVWGQERFTIADIRVEGLQRVSAGTVFNYLPVAVGSEVDAGQFPELIRELFKTGFFTDVRLARDGDVLVVIVDERPAVGEINISGNQDIGTDDLRQSLASVGLAEGRVFDRALLERVEQELLRQYFGRGKYAVRLESEVRNLPRNRVAIDLDISEGVAARIRQINIVGNQTFDDDELLDEFQLTTPGFFTIFSRNDQYSRQKLAADIEALRSYYLDRGFLRFNVDSTQVTITPDKKDIYITVNVSEGEQYTLRNVELAGELVFPEEELRTLVDAEVRAGEVFSRSAATRVTTAIADRFGNEGYAFAEVNPLPQIIEASNEVDLTFTVDPGNRVYVRRINFAGNLKTNDEVLRRELRQMEGGFFSKEKIDRSRVRLQRLEYLTQVDLDTAPVPGADDQVDLNFNIAERPAGSVQFGVGFGQESGLLLQANVSQKNFLGTGNEVGFAFNNSDARTLYSFSYNNPFYTLDGISRGIRLSYEETDAGENNTADYILDGLRGELQYGFPINEFDTFRVGVGYDGLRLRDTESTPDEIVEFLDQEGERFDNFVLRASFARDSRNRVIFANEGMLNRASAEVALPGSDNEYYKVDLQHASFFGLTDDLTFSLRARVGYGDGYGDSDELPFFENYFAGGLSTVRGFEANTLGPRYASNNEPAGGSFRLNGGADLLFPAPFFADNDNVKLIAFADVGTVFEDADAFEASELRYSAGVALQWLSPFGPLVLSLAQPFNDDNDDEIERFQFSFGVPF